MLGKALLELSKGLVETRHQIGALASLALKSIKFLNLKFVPNKLETSKTEINPVTKGMAVIMRIDIWTSMKQQENRVL